MQSKNSFRFLKTNDIVQANFLSLLILLDMNIQFLRVKYALSQNKSHSLLLGLQKLITSFELVQGI